MKRLSEGFVVALILFLFSSCSKGLTCTCTYTNTITGGKDKIVEHVDGLAKANENCKEIGYSIAKTQNDVSCHLF